MDLYNIQNEEIKISQLENLFHETLPSEEVIEYIHLHSFRFNREEEIVIELSFLDLELNGSVSISKENRTIIFLRYLYANYIKILDEKRKIFEIKSEGFEFNLAESKSILSLTGSPILQFNDNPNNEKRTMDVNPTDLMLLFDDFDEIQSNESNNKAYRFLCKRFSETAELTIFPGTGKLDLIIKSGDTLLISLNLIYCDRIVTNFKEKKVYFTSGFEELDEYSYIECQLDLGEYLQLLVQGNSRPFLRGLG